jgi:uncharacterized protein (DUF1499 family)
MRRLATLGFGLGVLAAVMGLTAAFGYQLGLLSIRTSLLTLLAYAAYAGGAAAVVSLAALVGLLASRTRTTRALAFAILGVLIGGAVIGIPGSMRYESRRNGYPPIHDIMTDTEDPPQFVDVLPLRANAPNKVEYPGERIAVQQHRAYPDLKPVTLNVPPDQAFDRAAAAARDMGWDMVSADRSAGRIEATDTTFWFRFKDDVVIRLRPVEGGTRVDVRSLSRVGGGDVGTNAKRIRAYVERLTAAG